MSSGGFIDLVSAYTMHPSERSKGSARDPTPDELRELLSRRGVHARRFLRPVDTASPAEEKGESEPAPRSRKR